MKKTLTAALTASMLAAAVLAGCGQKAEAPAETTTEAAAEETTAEETTAEETAAEETEAEAQGVPAFEYTGENAYVAAICDYMKENIVKNYEPADVSIPAVDVIREDDSDENNIKVWCRIWLDNYALKGTTLMSRSIMFWPGYAGLGSTETIICHLSSITFTFLVSSTKPPS